MKLQNIFANCVKASAVIASLTLSGLANATPYSGSANYGPGATDGAFDTYDFSSGGVALFETIAGSPLAPAVGDTVQGYYQSYVANHLFSDILVGAGGLNSDYQLTIVASFTQEVTTVIPGVFVEAIILGGTASIYLDTGVSYDFETDSGFTSGTEIMSATITGGVSSFFPLFGNGSSQLNFDIDFFDASIFNPATLLGGVANFDLSQRPDGFTSSISSVQGNDVGPGSLLLEADGSARFTANPVPAPSTLGLIAAGLAAMRIRKRNNQAELQGDHNNV